MDGVSGQIGERANQCGILNTNVSRVNSTQGESITDMSDHESGGTRIDTGVAALTLVR